MANFGLFFFGHILALYWPYMARGEHPVFIFFIDARDGTAGGRVGGRMSRASMKKNKNEHPLCTIYGPHMAIYGPYINPLEHIRHARNSSGSPGFPAVLVPNRPDLTPPNTRRGPG